MHSLMRCPGGLALLLACIGLFGLMSYSVSLRTNEIGVRIALGAQREAIVGMVMRESMALVAVAVVLGLAATLAAGQLVALGAEYLPARPASRVDPMTALRYESRRHPPAIPPWRT